MEPHDHLKHFLNQVIPLSESDWELVLPHWEVVSLNKGDHILEEGQICRHLWFVHEGLIRQYSNKDGKESTLHFTDRTDFLTLFDSLYLQTGSECAVQAIEPTVLLTIPYHKLQAAYDQSHMVERVGRLMVERAFLQFVEQVRRYSTQSPTDRLHELETNFPDIARRVPQKILATYLGIQPESLSRIRKRRVRPENN